MKEVVHNAYVNRGCPFTNRNPEDIMALAKEEILKLKKSKRVVNLEEVSWVTLLACLLFDMIAQSIASSESVQNLYI
jgi:biotin synthase-related radical SAM superfamily protein